MKKKRLMMWVIALGIFGILTGCGSNSDAENSQLTIAIMDKYVSSERVEEYVEAANLGENVEVIDLSMGDSKSDPMGTIAGTASFTGKVAAKELDIVIAPADVVASSARSETFYALEELLSEEEYANIDEERKIDFVILDDELQETGERTVPYGVDISEDTLLQEVLGDQEFGIYVVCNTTHLEEAKALFLQYIQ